ncbi:quinone oxidoreductase family protein [Wolbachia endosymbiont of Dirofilaria (Dirofilaria) immitis]|uniref:quinone oxidoreductase family protein n=1 Tax=Wolbachia endosymbiont of Dirofilaria (Dirofilaria) immitis TaxID=1812115 RepID=UPI00158F01F7|nr:quinone oxidoreductase [Wolbachia endosymbiont of Dirofilaria (Dirofilaria) immitis]QKX02505.1 zinc-binding dehydrogenase [Wolbachia endosymbiont of Dirofilaria (Dirofilaria) immitis]
MVRAVQIKRTGGIEVLEFIDINIDDPKDEEALVRHTAIGLNRYDLEHRKGIRKTKNLPSILGVEAVGVVEKLGKKISNGLQIGDRVGYCTAPIGAYCERRIIHQKYLIKIPDKIPDEIVAAVLFKGMTAHYLVNQSYKIKPGAVVLVHGANGGIGQILCQWASDKKGIVIGSVSSDEKMKIALQNGCTYAINYHDENFVFKIMKITQNKGVGAVYDPIGYATSKLSFKSLGKFGIYVSYGQISGNFSISFSLLSSRSLFATGTSIYHYKHNRFTLLLTAMEIFEMIRKKLLTVRINRKYKFDEIIEAHLDMENRKVSGLNIIKLP